MNGIAPIGADSGPDLAGEELLTLGAAARRLGLGWRRFATLPIPHQTTPRIEQAHRGGITRYRRADVEAWPRCHVCGRGVNAEGVCFTEEHHATVVAK